jgi:Cu-Zn family superoxide dismutase
MKQALYYCLAAAVIALGSGAGGALAFGEKAAGELKDKAGTAIGRVELFEASGGVLLKVKLKGLPSGAHALRILDTGKCEGDFASAGEIYNPLGAKYGFLNEEGPMAGEVTNIYASATGEAEAESLNHFISLGKETEEPLLDADGASIVVFEGPADHFTEPDGNAGARIACGVISPAK